MDEPDDWCRPIGHVGPGRRRPQLQSCEKSEDCSSSIFGKNCLELHRGHGKVCTGRTFVQYCEKDEDCTHDPNYKFCYQGKCDQEPNGGGAGIIGRRRAEDEVIGYYSWNYGKGSVGPAGANAGVAAVGIPDIDLCIKLYSTGASWCCPELKGTNYLMVGGGGLDQPWTPTNLAAIPGNCPKITAAGYNAVMFDIEVFESGTADQFVSGFAAAFKACKAAGLKVGITTSASGPYHADPATAKAVVQAWMSDPNIDVLSPETYRNTTGQIELRDAFSCPGCYEFYKTFKGTFAPSVSEAADYDTVKQYFSDKYGITAGGFFQWNQVAA